MSKIVPIDGRCEAGWEKVAGAFQANFSDHEEIGAAVSVVVDGSLVVDLFGGYKSANSDQIWQNDTLTNIWSTTKGVVAVCFAMLVDRGLLKYDDKVSHHWPEFAAAGKDRVTIGMLLSHQAGLSGFRHEATIEDFYDARAAAERLAEMEPWWTPGTKSGYHATTIGFLATELFQRVEGRSLKHFISDELTDFEVTIGLPEDIKNKASTLEAPSNLDPTATVGSLEALQVAALANPPMDPQLPNTAAWRAAEIPAANGFATSRGLARLYGELARDGGSLLSKAALDQATALQISGVDAVLSIEASWASGFLLNTNGIYGPNPESFGHSGWGGSFAFADRERRIGMSYVMNKMGTDLIGDPRNTSLVAAVYNSLSD